MPLPKTGKSTDAQRRAKNKYQAAHFSVLTCKIPLEDAEKFRAMCAGQGVTVNRAVSDYVDLSISLGFLPVELLNSGYRAPEQPGESDEQRAAGA